MTVWNRPVSWSKFKLALDCPRSLQYAVDKKPHGFADNTYYSALGTIVQFIFEQYFNQRVNLRQGGRNPKVIERVTDKILASNYIESLKVVYPYGKDRADLCAAVREQVTKGFLFMDKMGLTKYSVKSEVNWSSVFRGFRMFAKIDFLRHGSSGSYVFDGKGHKEMNADPRQVLYYCLSVAASGHKIAGGGIIYWRHGYKNLDVTPAALKRFIDGEFAEVRPLFEELKTGIQGPMEARPSKENCKFCKWRQVCPDSAVRRPPMKEDAPENVGFSEILVEDG